MFIPNELKHLIGRVSEKELDRIIKIEYAKLTYKLEHGLPTTMVRKVHW